MEKEKIAGTDTPIDMAPLKPYVSGAGAASVTYEELLGFAATCTECGVDPSKGEVVLLKQSSKEKAAPVVNIQLIRKRVAASGSCKGWHKGLIVAPEAPKSGPFQTERVTGSMVPPGFVLLGAWCRVLREGWDSAYDHTVSIEPFLKGKGDHWTQPYTAMMILKVVESQALRTVFADLGISPLLVFDEVIPGFAKNDNPWAKPITDKPKLDAEYSGNLDEPPAPLEKAHAYSAEEKAAMPAMEPGAKEKFDEEAAEVLGETGKTITVKEIEGLLKKLKEVNSEDGEAVTKLFKEASDAITLIPEMKWAKSSKEKWAKALHDAVADLVL